MDRPPKPGEPKFVNEFEQLSVDFANTKLWRFGKQIDLLRGYEDIVSFVRQHGLIDDEAARKLSKRARREPASAHNAFRRSLQVRDTLFRIFDDVVDERKPRAVDIDRISIGAQVAAGHMNIRPGSSGYRLEYEIAAGKLERVVDPILTAAMVLLVSSELQYLSRCASRDCGYFFLDKTKNMSRRWCAMSICGNRAKARRFRKHRLTGDDKGSTDS